MAKQVAEKPHTNLAVIDYSQDAGAGVKGMTAADVALPFIVILQKGSPQVDKDHANHAEFADGEYETGDLFDTVTREKFKELEVINCGYMSSYVEWKPRDSGGGFVAQHPMSTDLIKTTKRNDKNQDVLPNGNLLVLTHYHYCLVLKPNGDIGQCVISMTSTQLKKSRRWNSLLMAAKVPTPDGQVQAPRFANMWRLTTTPEKNDRGNWRGWVIEPMGLVSNSALYMEAREFFKTIEAGLIKVTPPAQEQESVTEDVPY